MPPFRQGICLLLAFAISFPLAARQRAAVQSPSEPLVITAAADGTKVRFSSTGDTCEIRVQILSQAGDSLFDSGWQNGNMLDWQTEGPGQPLTSGSYRCVVMVMDLEGNVTRREDSLTAQEGQVAFEEQPEGGGLTIVKPDDNGPRITLLSHDGSNGAIVSTMGDLSFRFGNFFAGREEERMRLTAGGDLQLNGLIHARGIVFPDGSTLTTANGAVAAAGGFGGSAATSGQGRPNTQPNSVIGLRPPLIPLPASPPRPTSAPPAAQFVVNATGVSVGTTNPTYSLNVTGSVSAGGRSQVTTPSDAVPNSAFVAVCNGSDPGCSGVYGIAFAPGSSGYGSGAFGILGFGTGASGGGVSGIAGGAGGVGVYGGVRAPATIAGYFAGDVTVTGAVAAGGRSQVVSPSDSVPSSAFVAVCNGSSPACDGVYGLAFAPGSSGIGSGAFGIRGYASGTNGGGVYGVATGTNGVGVYGTVQSGATEAGYFAGNVDVTGTLTKGAGSFKIDDPLDPENKYLSHSFVESPDMMNIYNGNVILDRRGEAVVQLPDWFEALNRDFRYQLTCLHGFAPVYIDEEISDHHFKIAGGKPGMKVSWQVTGVRHDPYANAHRIPIEQDKTPAERGKYLHPIEYGQPPDRGTDYQH